jgi:hypothetical protein
MHWPFELAIELLNTQVTQTEALLQVAQGTMQAMQALTAVSEVVL